MFHQNCKRNSCQGTHLFDNLVIRGHSDGVITASKALPSAIAERSVHLWNIPVCELLSGVAAFRALLSENEREQAARYHVGREGIRYTVYRGALRFVVGGYAGLAAESVRFGTGRQGKPLLDHAANGAHASADLDFNLSHAHDRGMLVLTRGAEVGVDVERVRLPRDLVTLVNHFFRPEEARAVLTAAPEHRPELFCKIWTRKEAVVKAVGGSLPEIIGDFAVFSHTAGRRGSDTLSNEPVQLELPIGGSRLMYISDLPAPSGFVAALSSSAPIGELSVFQLPDYLSFDCR